MNYRPVILSSNLLRILNSAFFQTRKTNALSIQDNLGLEKVEAVRMQYRVLKKLFWATVNLATMCNLLLLICQKQLIGWIELFCLTNWGKLMWSCDCEVMFTAGSVRSLTKRIDDLCLCLPDPGICVRLHILSIYCTEMHAKIYENNVS